VPFAVIALQFRWRALLIPATLVVILFVVASQAQESSLAFMLGGAPHDALALPNAAALVHQMVLHTAALVAASAGMLVSVSLFEMQRALRMWTVPSLHRAVRRDSLIILAGLMGTLGLWAWRWAEPPSIAAALVLVPWWFGLFAAIGHLVARSTERPWVVGALPFVALLIVAARPALYVAAVGTLGWAGGAVLSAAGAALLWYTTTPALHRAVGLFKPAVRSAGDVAHPFLGVPGPNTLVQWFRWLGNEAGLIGFMQRVGMLPQLLIRATNGAVFGTLIYLMAGDVMMIAMTDWYSGLATGSSLWYPLSRTQRARLQFLDQTVALLVVIVVTSLVYWLFWSSGAPRLPFAMDSGRHGTGHTAVAFAAAFALFPIAQIPRAFAPLMNAAHPRPFSGRLILLSIGTYLPFALLAKFLERSVWQYTSHDLLTSLLLCAAVALPVQAASYLMLRAVFARRDLTAALR
jgi:hypothetical protein